MYKAEILADSKCPRGNRLTTMKITFPRFILAEMNTHRMFSRNSASSRAIPFKKMVKMVEENPFIPIAWQRDHKGMQGTEYIIDSSEIREREQLWLAAKDRAVELSTQLYSTDVTKQLCNRLLEPFMWHTVIITSGKEGLDNFFKLRCPQYILEDSKDVKSASYKSWKDVCNSYPTIANENHTLLQKLSVNESQADIHIQAIAELMWDAYNESTPKELKEGEWHIPFGDNIDSFKYEDKVKIRGVDEKIKIATARCARISYETLGDINIIDYEADIRLHDRLMESGHWSPFEHIAVAMTENQYLSFIKGELGFEDTVEDDITEKTVMYLDGVDIDNPSTGWCNNFRGFIQYRYLVGNFKQTNKN